MTGAWGQVIDDFADANKENRNQIYTVFTSSSDQLKTLEDLSEIYESRIRKLTKREDFIVPLAKDLVQLAKMSRFPVISYIFGALNC